MEKVDTIAALATPRGLGALAALRISGNNSIKIFARLINQKEKFLNIEKNRISVYQIIDKNNNIVDEVTAVKYLSPNSYTGEDMVEIFTHGGNTAADTVLEMIIEKGARYAKRGEFTRRAFCNGKKSIVSAEAVETIISSRDRSQLKNAVKSYMGGYIGPINNWKKRIEDISIKLETAIEFEEDNDIEKKDTEVLSKEMKDIRKDIEEQIKIRNKVKKNDNMIKIVTAGPQNAGKSSIVNLILGFDRVIVDDERGTTRDFVSERVEICKREVEIIDTAGICRSGSEIERKAIERSWGYIESADIVLWVTAADEKFYDEELDIEKRGKGDILALINKTDLTDGKEKEDYFRKRKTECLKTDAKNKGERNNIISIIENKIDEEDYEDLIINTERQEQILKNVVEEIRSAEKQGVEGVEIRAYHCRNILGLFDEFVGVKLPQEIMDEIFDRFCVGK